ncbi:hypothetical protein DFH28DRAFT_970059 [Melampsora americana]|nr:hypothetical protein DFH28DRAFT_970059 [Melampsora americana]
MIFSLSFLPASLLNSPKWSKNPYRAASAYANSVLAPKFPTWALGLLIAFVVMRVIFMIRCTAIISIPFFQGPFSQRKHLFLVHQVYTEKGRTIPYLVPNRCMIIVICELFSSMLYTCGAWFSYCYKVKDALHGGPRQLMTLWYDISSYIGIVLSSWGLCYACLCDVGGTKNRKFSKLMTPIVYNAIWISWTVIAFGIILYWSVMAVSVLTRLEDRLQRFFRMLDDAAISWDTHHDFSNIPLTAICADALSLFHDWKFFMFVVRVLLTMLNQVLGLRELHSMTVSLEWNSPIWKELEIEFSIFQAFSGSHLDLMTWRIASALLTHLPGVFMAPALLLQSYHTVPVSHQNSFMPQMTSQLLGWDTNLCLGKIEEEMRTVNFPGLLQIKKEKLDLGGIDKTPVNDQKNPNIDITVICSTVITQDKL